MDRDVAFESGSSVRRRTEESVQEQLERTKRSSAYTTNILSSRECKIAHYHETMARMIKD